jgi:hypothetical protein
MFNYNNSVNQSPEIAESKTKWSDSDNKSTPKTNGNMYQGVSTWNPFRGCHFDCTYCAPSFKQQAFRQKHNCPECYNFTPHFHPERLQKIPSAATIFVGSCGDWAFSRPEWTRAVIEAVKKHRSQRPKTFYFQSKAPKCFAPFVNEFPDNVILLTTLETNKDDIYEGISKAPKPTERYQQFLELDYPRKVITMEPLIDFDLDVMVEWVKNINPLYVWIGVNSKPKQVQLPEPDPEKVEELIIALEAEGIEVRRKKTLL